MLKFLSEIEKVVEKIVEKPVEKIVEKIVEVPKETYLRIDEIEPNRFQPRKNFDEDSLQELADSIRQFGVIQPLVVQKTDYDFYELSPENVAGGLPALPD